MTNKMQVIRGVLLEACRMKSRPIAALTHMWNGPDGKVFFAEHAPDGRCSHMSGL
jgi:hypothetical protein